MSKTNQILFAGFGGQGILFAGKAAAYTGLMGGKHVSWLPSYGPEMRGGTANCHVIISDEPVGSPIIVNPTELVVMNRPSLEKFEQAVAPGGNIIVDCSLVDITVKRTDVTQHLIAATQMANDAGMPRLANMIMFGKLIQVIGTVSMETVEQGLQRSIPPSKKELLALNMKAILMGYEHQ